VRVLLASSFSDSNNLFAGNFLAKEISHAADTYNPSARILVTQYISGN
jgi:hypothetical protein